ncbi:MAG: hypothetical protein HGJ94_22535 [Desulfosarcina sp.]|nr:hypothetical protein [Desulfosarcina sp.]MBC2743239.1 hypothetical protein [Desulfosarcina sp.]MBC2766150.1 hypothetical protein [Desulfosarcina sp.]
MRDLLKNGAATIRGIIFALMLFGLPLLGIIAVGRNPAPYLEMPPVTRYVQHAGFAWPWFAFFAIADLVLISGLVWAIRCGQKRKPHPIETFGFRETFPWWGFAGMALCLISWLMAWKRFTWFWLFQPHTFLPIWAGFILTINALSVKRSGSCLILRRPLRFLLLFPASAGFWWIFEYLNRFVQNWYYTGIEGMAPGDYTYFSSLAFATVLPGVLSMIDLLLTVPALGKGLARCRQIKLPSSRLMPLITLTVAGVGLALIGILPDQLFALLWVSPLIIILSIQRLTGRRTLLYPLRRGDWRPVVVPALAALICGFFWETWNFFSLARWSYTIPYVQRFHLFEMPILGFGGYLPFGLECLVAGTMVAGDPFRQENEN